MVVGDMAGVMFDTYDTPHQPESVGHGENWSLWRWYSGIATARTIIITAGVASPSPGRVYPSTDEIDAADDSTSTAGGKAIWYATNETQTVTSAEGTIFTTAGYDVT